MSTINTRLLLLSLLATSPAAADPIQLTDVARASGLGKLAFHGATWYAAGVVFADLDADGWADIYFGAAEGEVDTFCRNQRDGTFACGAAEGAPVNQADVLALAAGDYDGDGDLDIYVMRKALNSLLQNDGSGRFHEVTEATHTAGLASRLTTTGTFFDYDRDGRLDLYLGHWFASRVMPNARDQILHQLPDGTFVDALAEAGVNDQNRSSLAMIAFDYDRDGWPDLYVSGDFAQALLFHNDGGHYSDVTLKQDFAFRTAVTEGMGIDVADLDGDGRTDLYVTGNKVEGGGNGAALLINRGDGTFNSEAAARGVNTGFSWGTGVVDLDNDSWPDIFVATDVADHYSIFRNQGGAFTEEDLPGLESGTNQCVTVAFADYDNDGRVDVLLHRIDGHHPQLLHNVTPAGHYLQVLVRRGASFGDVLGAKVRVTAGGRTQEREILSQSSKGAQNDRRLTFGLGEATRADIEVDFPDGQLLGVENVAADREIVVDPQGVVADPGIAPPRQAGCTVGGRPAAAPLSLALLALGLALLRRRRR